MLIKIEFFFIQRDFLSIPPMSFPRILCADIKKNKHYVKQIPLGI